MTWLVLGVLVLWLALGPWVLVGLVAALFVPRLRWWVQDRIWIDRRRAALSGGVVAAVVALVVVVPDGWLPIPQSPGLLVTPRYVGRPAADRPVAAGAIAQNPHLTRNGVSSRDGDATATDSYPWAGPMGLEPEVDTAWSGLEQCGTLTVDSAGRVIALCGDRGAPTVRVIDPASMRTLASKALPQSGKDDQPGEACTGAFYLDASDRVVVATNDRRILVISTADVEGEPDLTTDKTWDLTGAVAADDCVVALLPDWSGRIWFETQTGLVGALAPRNAQVETLDLEEDIATGLALDESGGTYVVTTHAVYRLSIGSNGAPRVDWRTGYDRGSEKKSGQLSQGSGTTPTIIDGGIVAITDNAEPQMDVVFFERSSGREICREPVFADDSGSTQSSLASVGGGVIVTNSHGYTSPAATLLGRATSPGIARVDVAGGACKLVWTSDEIAPSGGAKVSLANGLAYAYTKKPTWWGVSAWYFTALDVVTGRTVFSVRTGSGVLMNNNRAPLTITPAGAAWVSTLAGLVRIRDRVRD